MKQILLMIAVVGLVGCGTEAPTMDQQAEAGDAETQYSLGEHYANGYAEYPQDYKEGARWYRKAAEQGHVRAMFELGDMYNKGKGVPQDFKETAKWYRKSAEQGHSKAQWMLGGLYVSGEGVPKDYVTAYAWVWIAVTNGDLAAKKVISTFHELVADDDISKGKAMAEDMISKNPKLLK